MNRIWHLNAIEQPEQDGIYEVRLCKKSDLLSVYYEYKVEFRNGLWMALLSDINGAELYVHSWRCL